MKNLIFLGAVTIAVVGTIAIASQFLSGSEFKLSGLRASGSDLLRQAKPGTGSAESGNPNLVEEEVYRQWSMFSNDEYRLTLRYPPELTVNSSAVQLLSAQPTTTLVQLIKHGSANSRGTSITVQVQDIGEKSLDQIVAEFNGGKILFKQETTVDGIRALRLWVQSPLEESDQLQEDYLFVKKDNYLFTFSSVGDENRAQFEKIIKTVTLSY
jgi:hypothetical protein